MQQHAGSCQRESHAPQRSGGLAGAVLLVLLLTSLLAVANKHDSPEYRTDQRVGSLLAAGNRAGEPPLSALERVKNGLMQPQLTDFTPLQVEPAGSAQAEGNRGGAPSPALRQAQLEQQEQAAFIREKTEEDKAKATLSVFQKVFGLQPEMMVAMPPGIQDVMLRTMSDMGHVPTSQTKGMSSRSEPSAMHQTASQLSSAGLQNQANAAGFLGGNEFRTPQDTVEHDYGATAKEGRVVHAQPRRVQALAQYDDEHSFRVAVRDCAMLILIPLLLCVVGAAFRILLSLSLAIKGEMEASDDGSSRDDDEERAQRGRAGGEPDDDDDDDDEGSADGLWEGVVAPAFEETWDATTRLARKLCWEWPLAAVTGLASLAGMEMQAPRAEAVICAGGIRKSGAYCGPDAAFVLQTWLESQGLSVYVLPTDADTALDDTELESVLVNSHIFIALVDDQWVESETEDNLRKLAVAYHCTSHHQRPTIFVYHDPECRYLSELSVRSHELGTHNCAPIPKVSEMSAEVLDAALHALKPQLPDEETLARPRNVPLHPASSTRPPASPTSLASPTHTAARSIQVLLNQKVAERKSRLDASKAAKLSARGSATDRSSWQKTVMQPTYARPPINFNPVV